jgi:hypothetical protein
MMVVVHMNMDAATVTMHDPMNVRLCTMLLVAVVVDRHIQSRRQDSEDEDCGDHGAVPVHAAKLYALLKQAAQMLPRAFAGFIPAQCNASLLIGPHDHQIIAAMVGALGLGRCTI